MKCSNKMPTKRWIGHAVGKKNNDAWHFSGKLPSGTGAAVFWRGFRAVQTRFALSKLCDHHYFFSSCNLAVYINNGHNGDWWFETSSCQSLSGRLVFSILFLLETLIMMRVARYGSPYSQWVHGKLDEWKLLSWWFGCLDGGSIEAFAKQIINQELHVKDHFSRERLSAGFFQ